MTCLRGEGSKVFIPLMEFYFYLLSSQVLSYDGLHSPDCLAVTAAGIAV